MATTVLSHHDADLRDVHLRAIQPRHAPGRRIMAALARYADATGPFVGSLRTQTAIAPRSNPALSRQVRAGTLQRLSPGLYLNPYLSPPADAAEQLAGYLRRDDFCYLSLESALHEHGWLAQVPNRLTLMTTGPSHTYNTAVGIIEFTHTRRKLAAWRPQTVFDRNRRMYVASPELALADLKHVGRNLDLVYPEH